MNRLFNHLIIIYWKSFLQEILLGFRNTITESLLLLSFLRFFALFEKTIKDRSIKFYMLG